MKNHVPIMTIFSELPDRESVVRQAKNVILFINDKSLPVTPKAVYYPPLLAGGSYLSWAVVLTPELVGALKMAKRIGSGVSPGPSDVFAGVAGINVGEGRRSWCGR
ncbi:MAG: hypothetical protein ACR2KT_10050 [Methylocella sp.]|nr:MAG: hypothetical protein DLM68_12235 [Hyphomicrobiales bacterium]